MPQRVALIYLKLKGCASLARSVEMCTRLMQSWLR
jgi:hypothetical protein